MYDRNCFALRLCLISACLMAALPAAGQIIYGQQAAGSLDIVSTHWTLSVEDDEVSVDQWAIPATVFLPLGENFEGQVYVARSMSTVSQLGEDFALNGLTDMRLQVKHSFARDRLLLGAGVNLPVGYKELDLTEEFVVMSYLTQSFLTFPVRNLGQGFGVNLMAGGATEMGDYKLGATATWDLTGAYEAYAYEDDYNPGNTLVLTMGVQRGLDNLLFNGDVSFTVSGDDQQGDVPVFSRSEQVSLHGGLIGGDVKQRYFGDLIYNIRGRNTSFDPAGFLLQQLKFYGNEFIAAGGLERTTNSGWGYGGSADIRLIAANEVGLGKSRILGLGGQVSRALTPAVSMKLALKYFTGSTQGGDIDLSGFQTWLAASGTF